MAAAVAEIPQAILPYVAKWQVREPEMRVAQVFCPPERLLRFLAWGALLHELREALFELSTAQIIAVKSGWWAEEMLALSRGAPRHPLTHALAGVDAPWPDLARAILQFLGDDERRADSAQAISALLPLARSVAAVEGALFTAEESDDAARALAIHWLWQRLPQGLDAEDRARIPMHLFARHALSPAALVAGEGLPLLRDWAAELSAALPKALPDSAFPARARVRFDQARLDRLAAGQSFGEPPALGTLWRAWRAARAG